MLSVSGCRRRPLVKGRQFVVLSGLAGATTPSASERTRAINVRYWGKTDTAHGLKADHA